jgi:hypothetical protein
MQQQNRQQESLQQTSDQFSSGGSDIYLDVDRDQYVTIPEQQEQQEPRYGSFYSTGTTSREKKDTQVVQGIIKYESPPEVKNDNIDRIKESCDLIGRVHLREISEMLISRLHMILLQMRKDATDVLNLNIKEKDADSRRNTLKIIERLNDYIKKVAERTKEFSDASRKEKSAYPSAYSPYQMESKIESRRNKSYESNSNILFDSSEFESNSNNQQQPQNFRFTNVTPYSYPQNIEQTSRMSVPLEFTSYNEQRIPLALYNELQQGKTETITYSSERRGQPKRMTNMEDMYVSNPSTQHTKNAPTESTQKSTNIKSTIVEEGQSSQTVPEKGNTKRAQKSEKSSSLLKNISKTSSKSEDVGLKLTKVYIYYSYSLADKERVISYVTKSKLTRHITSEHIEIELHLLEDDTHFYANAMRLANLNNPFDYVNRVPRDELLHQIYFDQWYGLPEFEGKSVITISKQSSKDTVNGDYNEVRYIGNSIKVDDAEAKTLHNGICNEVVGLHTSGITVIQYYTEKMLNQFMKINNRLIAVRFKKHIIDHNNK